MVVGKGHATQVEKKVEQTLHDDKIHEAQIRVASQRGIDFVTAVDIKARIHFRRTRSRVREVIKYPSCHDPRGFSRVVGQRHRKLL